MSDLSGKSDMSREPTRAFAALFTAYTKTVNNTYHRTGRLFQEHFGRIEVTSDTYFTNLIFCIHSNPQKHGFVADFRDWPWTSYGAMITDQPTRVNRTQVLDWFRGVADFTHFHQGTVDERCISILIRDDFE